MNTTVANIACIFMGLLAISHAAYTPHLSERVRIIIIVLSGLPGGWFMGAEPGSELYTFDWIVMGALAVMTIAAVGLSLMKK